jgi:hypothetical protein
MKTYSIVGMNFRKAEDFVKSLPTGIEATLVREPQNPFDANAVAVWINGRHVGYVPKAQNKVLADFIDQQGGKMALDGALIGEKAIPAKFVRSPNSGYPMVEV